MCLYKRYNRYNSERLKYIKATIRVSTKNNSGCFASQNSRFYRAKPTLLERKTIGFAMR